MKRWEDLLKPGEVMKLVDIVVKIMEGY